MTGYWPELRGQVDFFEVDALATGARRSKTLISAGHSFLKEDRVTELREICESRGATACILKLPPSYWLWENAERKLSEFQTEWKQLKSCMLSVDPGRSGAPSSFATDIQWAADPFWPLAGRVSTSSLWRIHGWHQERWVRRYSKAQLTDLAAAICKWRPKFVILGHSQRVAQLPELLEILSGGK